MSDVDNKNGAGHVQFSVDSDKEHTNVIVLQVVDEHTINAHIGFLKLNHIYEIDLKIPSVEGVQYEVLKEPSLAVKDVCIEPDESDKTLKMKVQFFAHKQKLLKEKITLSLSPESNVTVILCARILGPNQGTPMLREGVRLTGVVPVEESEVSDWQGFD